MKGTYIGYMHMPQLWGIKFTESVGLNVNENLKQNLRIVLKILIIFEINVFRGIIST